MTEDDNIAAEASCVRLQQRYGTLADRLDPSFRELFAEDATITLPEYPPFAGLEAIMAGQTQWRASGTLMRHICTNFTVDVVDGEHASGICYLVVFYGGVQAPEIGEVAPTWPISVGEFHDQFVKLEGKWVFQSRVLRRIFRGAAPS